MMRMRRELVFVPDNAKWSATGLLVLSLLVIDLMEIGLSVIDPLETGLNDHELIHEVEGTVDEPAVKNREVAEWANWAAGFF